MWRRLFLATGDYSQNICKTESAGSDDIYFQNAFRNENLTKLKLDSENCHGVFKQLALGPSKGAYCVGAATGRDQLPEDQGDETTVERW